MSNKHKTSFWQYISSTKGIIIIPVIQRDYAQGRPDKAFVRKRFLTSLMNALDPDIHQNLVLDFIYGSEENNRFYPLDGQQRLTTLWLFHWYLAYINDKFKDTENLVSKILNKFSYETRTSSSEFCANICKMHHSDYRPEIDSENNRIINRITNQRWFYSAYNQDPTISSMLVMLGGSTMDNKGSMDILDGIEKIFQDEKHWNNRLLYWEKLTNLGDDCPIQFYILNINDNNMLLTDDLYIKMNARGKALTDMENFKADLLNYPENKEPKLIQEDSTDTNSFAVLMDTTWTDLFWGFHSCTESDPRIDEIYFMFVNRFFLGWYITHCKTSEIKTTNFYKHVYKTTEPYQSIDTYRPILNPDCLSSLKKTLNSINHYYGIIKNNNSNASFNKMFEPYWQETISDKRFRFIPEYINSQDDADMVPVSDLSVEQYFVFFGICKYFELAEDKVNSIKLNQWIRFLWNMVINSYIDEDQLPSATKTIINLKKELGFNEEDHYSILDIEEMLSAINLEDIRQKQIFGKRQLIEEISKATQKHKTDKNWRLIIETAEKTLNGAIGFLFNDNKNSLKCWQHFEEKYSMFNKLFDDKGLKKDTAAKTEAIFISHCKDFYSLLNHDKKIFSTDMDTWRNKIFLRTEYDSYNYTYAEPIHCLLLGMDIAQISDEEYTGASYIHKLANPDIWDHIWSLSDNKPMYIRENKTMLHVYGDKNKGLFLDYDMRDNLIHSLLLNDSKHFELRMPDIVLIPGTSLLWGGQIDFIYIVDNYKFNFIWNNPVYNPDSDICLADPYWNPVRNENNDLNKYGFSIAELEDKHTQTIDIKKLKNKLNKIVSHYFSFEKWKSNVRDISNNTNMTINEDGGSFEWWRLNLVFDNSIGIKCIFIYKDIKAVYTGIDISNENNFDTIKQKVGKSYLYNNKDISFFTSKAIGEYDEINNEFSKLINTFISSDKYCTKK